MDVLNEAGEPSYDPDAPSPRVGAPVWATATLDAERTGQLLRGAAMRTAIRNRLAPMLRDGTTLLHVRVQRVKVRPSTSMELWLEARLRTGEAVTRRPVSLRWSASAAPPDRVPAGETDGDLSVVADGSEPFARWSPFDDQFPNLARLLAPQVLSRALGVHDGSLDVGTVRYRPGERHVLRAATIDGGPGAARWFAKLARPGEGRAAYEVACAFAAAVDGDRTVVAVRPLALVDDAAVYPAVRGRAVSTLVPTDDRAAPWLSHAGRALAVVHGSGFGDHPKMHTLASALVTTERAVRHLRAWLASGDARLDDLLGRLGVLVGCTPESAIVSLHGDCKLDHLHRRASVMHLIDIDNSGRGEAALDIGNLLADVWWWARSAPAELVASSRQAVLDGYGNPPDATRVALAEAIALLRIAGRRPRIDRPGWMRETEGAVASVERLVLEIERTLGIGNGRAGA